MKYYNKQDFCFIKSIIANYLKFITLRYLTLNIICDISNNNISPNIVSFLPKMTRYSLIEMKNISPAKSFEHSNLSAKQTVHSSGVSLSNNCSKKIRKIKFLQSFVLLLSIAAVILAVVMNYFHVWSFFTMWIIFVAAGLLYFAGGQLYRSLIKPYLAEENEEQS